MTIVACGTEAPLPPEGQTTPSDSERSTAASNATDDGAAGQLESVSGAPGYLPFSYPEPPYGTERGAVMQNLEFLGWWSPLNAAYNVDAATTVSMAGFYDPTGEQGVELLLINSNAVWCGVCRAEYADLKENGTYAQYRPRGLEILGILFEDINGEPAKYTDLVNWTRTYEVDFPFVTDPGFKSGVYFDRSATPMNMLVDAKTMQILLVMTGYDPSMYDTIDRMLAERGR